MLLDISADITRAAVYPGDPAPCLSRVQRLEDGDFCNLSTLFCCLHNGTHADAPLHFVAEGKTIDQMPLRPFIGFCHVISVPEGVIDERVVRARFPAGCKRLLVKGGGRAYFSPEGARALAETGVLLVGIDAASVGAGDTQSETHRAFLTREIALLEGLRLEPAAEGEYILLAQPLRIGGAEAAPVRAVLAAEEDLR